MKAQITIVFKSFDKTNLLILNQNENRSWKREPKALSSVRLPKKRKLYTVLRSPHIDKKSREQFEMVIHKQCFRINTETQNIRALLLPLMQQDISGVQCKIIVNYKTRLPGNFYG